ncbi:hypothetical protein DPMN_168550 [Dreissena polymorpha]|uniref:Uncharacterized protein n=1 Tax=Dreissena polymorpha TaxID=45954 RepID=A0A9D4F6P7_DREPO|nr:hypothetical protein DPMN_168550 [Dreissena polymorpha]
MALFLNIARLPGSVEHQVLNRQLAMSNPDRNSFSTSIPEILHKYNLPPPEDLLQNPPSKHQWKTTFRNATTYYWESTWKDELLIQFTAKYIQVQSPLISHPHNLWASTDPKPHEVWRAELKARLLTGTYILQCNTARFNRSDVSATFKLWNMGYETREHLLLTCKAHTDVRSEGMNMLQQIIGGQEFAAIRCKGDILIQTILDCTHVSLQQHINFTKKQNTDVERWTHIYCERIISSRTGKLSVAM